MKFKKSMLILILAVFLISIAGVCASDVNDMAMASQDDTAMESTDENLIMVEDSEPALSTAENGEIVSDSADDEIVSAENDLDVLSANPGTYSGLSSEIGTGGNIVLTHDNYTYDSGSTINITKSNSVIDGNGAIIDMAGSNIRVFKVTGSGVTIKNLTIINANATEDNDGAAIYFDKVGTIENCNFINNYAGDAGAVYFNKANSKVINCNFTGNKAAFSGGALCFKESGTVENCNFVNNVAASNNIGSGGAISFNGTGNVINCSFANNSANGFSWSGAIYFNDGNVINCTFTNNKAWAGGAVGLYGNAKLENCSFDKNSANDGGAVEVIGAASIINCNFTDNKVLDEIYGYGGAVLWNTSAGNIKNCIFDKNSAFRGGAVYFEKDGEVTDCKFNDNLAGDGGAVWFTEDGTVENSIFVKNEAWNEYGGGICFYTTGKIRNCSFTDSKADKQGGAVYWNGAGTVENCNFTNNKAQDAGAIFFSEDSTVENCIFVKNSATDQRPDRYFGGAIVFYKNGDVTNSSFTENTATEGGAVLFKGNGKAINCDFTNNSAQFGGAIDFESRATVENCNFNGNIASSNGSAIWLNRAGGTVSSSVFVNNRANSGIIFFKNEDSASDLTINDNIFLNNRGVAIYFAKNDSVSNADYNWFGNNATNYDIEPIANNVEISTWLFLNATANLDPIPLIGSSDIIFKLYAYTPSGVSEYDNRRLHAVNLTLDLTNGGINATETGLGETVKFRPMDTGIGTLTATIENAAHTITLKITDGTTFYDLNYTINGNDNDTIVLDSDYTYNPTFDYNFKSGVVINRAVTIIGNGHILDAAGLVRIFNIQADNVVINNITFTNGKTNFEGGAICWSGANGNLSGCSFVNNSVNYYGGAIYWNGAAGGLVSDCSFVNNSGDNGGAIYWSGAAGGLVSDCTFANNSAYYGGAIFCDSGVGDVVSGCSFVNNTAGVGGAIYWWSSNEALVYDCSFVNNSVRYYAAAIYWRGNDGNVSGCSFVNNSKYSIYFYNDENIYHNLSINDNIFLNNTGVAIYFVNNDSSSNADYNWFGNNATNYDMAPVTNNVDINTWLFLNATANPDTISILDLSDIVFKLYAYNSSGISEYDNSRLKAVNLTLTLTNGRVNTTKTYLGEPVQYTPESVGIGTLKASIDNVVYTVTLKITDGTTFSDLNWVINGNDNDTIVLDRDYTYNSTVDYDLNEGIVIDRPVTVIGNGHTLDATGLARIFNIQSDNVIIKNITFTNANTNTFGGAIYWNGTNGNVSDCVFVNNSAAEDGGIIFWNGNDGVVSGCVFVNNSAEDGIIYFHNQDSGKRLTINNNIFLNNYDYVIHFDKRDLSSNVDYNWFGNNATDYDMAPATINVVMDSWLFLNATVNPNPISVSQSSDILFKLYSYSEEDDRISDYDNSRLPVVNLTLTANNGNVNESIVTLGDSVEFTPNGVGDASVTAAIENAEYTIVLDVVKEDAILIVDDLNMSYKDGSKLVVRLIDGDNNPISNALIYVNNTVTVYKYKTDADGVINVPVNLKPNEYTYNIIYEGDENYTATNATRTVVVDKGDVFIFVEDVNVTYKENENYTVVVCDVNGDPVSGVTVKVDNGAKVLRYRTGADGVANVPVTLKPGDYTFTVSFDGNTLYKAAGNSSAVVVNKAIVNMDAVNLVVGYKDGSNFTATLTDSEGNAISGVTVKFDNSVNAYRYHTDANGVASAPIKLKPGTYTYVISFAGNSIYASANITKTLTVEKGTPNLEASNVTVEYKNGNLTARLTDADGNAIVGATVKFTNGASTYRYHTDADGVATAPINVKPGEYDYTIGFDGNSLYGAVNTTAKVVVNKIDTVLTANNISMTFKDGTNYTARLTDTNGNAIAGVIVKVNNTVATYKYKTDADGYIHAPINLRLGEYAFNAFIEGSDIYNSCNVTSTVVITR